MQNIGDMNQASQTLLALKKLKVDCLYKKSTHFNAARRLKIEANNFRITLIFGTVVASFSTIMNVGIWDQIALNTVWIQVIVNILGALGGFLILYTSTFSDYKSKIEVANKHENLASDLNLVFKRIRNAEAYYQDKLMGDQKLVENLHQLTQEYTSKCSNAPITKDEDYLKAKENLKKGYTAEYTEEELNA